MQLLGILIIIIGFVLKLDVIAVVLVAGVTSGLLGGLSIVEILEIMGRTFVSQRLMLMFLLLLPIISISERYGLKERAATIIKNLKNISAGRIITIYQLIRELGVGLAGISLGLPDFVKPLVEPMAQSTAEAKYKNLNDESKELIKSASAAANNYGNFFAQNLFIANAGVLLIVGTLTELGYAADASKVSLSAIPVAIIAFILGIIQNNMLDKKINRLNKKGE